MFHASFISILFSFKFHGPQLWDKNMQLLITEAETSPTKQFLQLMVAPGVSPLLLAFHQAEVLLITLKALFSKCANKQRQCDGRASRHNTKILKLKKLKGIQPASFHNLHCDMSNIACVLLFWSEFIVYIFFL